MNIRRGDIIYVDAPGTTTGSEQMGNRPAIVVSNNHGNRCSPNVEIIYMTTREKKPLPTHFFIMLNGNRCTVMAEGITTISKQRIQKRIGYIGDIAVDKMNRCLAISVGLTE